MENIEIKVEDVEIKQEILCDESDQEIFGEVLNDEAVEQQILLDRLPSVPKKLYPVGYERPPLSYSNLIYLALKNSVSECLPVPGIYNFISYNFPYFRSASRNWKSAIRHSLSMNSFFKKAASKCETVTKNNLWTLKEEKRHQLDRILLASVERHYAHIKRTMLTPDKLDLFKDGECVTLFENNDLFQKKNISGPKILRGKKDRSKSLPNTISNDYNKKTNDIKNDDKAKCDKISDSPDKITEPDSKRLSILKRQIKTEVSELSISHDDIGRHSFQVTDDVRNDELEKYVNDNSTFLEKTVPKIKKRNELSVSRGKIGGLNFQVANDVRTDEFEKYVSDNNSFLKKTVPKIKKRNKLRKKFMSKSQINISIYNVGVDGNRETDDLGDDDDEKEEYNFVIMDNDSQHSIGEESRTFGDDQFRPLHESSKSQNDPVVESGIKDNGPKELFPRKHCCTGRKPIYLYKYMVMMAFKNSPSKQLSLKQIFNYMYENFSYFNTSKTSYWKRQVCRVLRTDLCFKRVSTGGENGEKRRMVWVLVDDLKGKDLIAELLNGDQSSVVNDQNLPFLAGQNVIPCALHFPGDLKREKSKLNKLHQLDEEMEIPREESCGSTFENEEEFDVNDTLQISGSGDNDMDFDEDDIENAEIDESDFDENVDDMTDGDNNQNENKTLLNVINRLKNSLLKRDTKKTSDFSESSIFSDKFYKPSFLNNRVKNKASMKCTKCYETFTDFDSLKSHLLNHSVVKATKCIECNKSFARYSDLKSHMLTAHDDLNRYNCAECDETFNDLNLLKIHMKDHSTLYKCVMCSEIFSRLSDLKVHVLKHANIEAFGCNFCDKVFVKHELLAIHMESHT